MRMTIQEYAKTKGVTYENVRAIIDRHQEELKGKIEKEGRTRYLTDEAQEVLDKSINVKTVTVLDNDAEIIRLKTIIDEERKEKKELKKELDRVTLEQENRILKLQNETLEKIRELEGVISEQKSLVDNSKLLLEQKDDARATLEQEKDAKIDLLATNRQARREYKREKKRREKELKKQAKMNKQTDAE